MAGPHPLPDAPLSDRETNEPMIAETAAQTFERYIAAQADKTLLRFITCGSVDDGKSTLIGRLLYDTKLIFDDQMTALEQDSKRHGTTGETPDLALLVDGLQAEREQGITIDVAYRFFATDKRRFIVADTPGHEQYTRNMATGASTADAAIVLIDARKGILTQTRRHSFILSLLSVCHIILAVNKMDLVEYHQKPFEDIVVGYENFASPLGFETIQAIPLSALTGENVVTPGKAMPWHQGSSLLQALETLPTAPKEDKPFRFPVQWVNRPHLDFVAIAAPLPAVMLPSAMTFWSYLQAKQAKLPVLQHLTGTFPMPVKIKPSLWF